MDATILKCDMGTTPGEASRKHSRKRSYRRSLGQLGRKVMFHAPKTARQRFLEPNPSRKLDA